MLIVKNCTVYNVCTVISMFVVFKFYFITFLHGEVEIFEIIK